jgi:hypothetical protein
MKYIAVSGLLAGALLLTACGSKQSTDEQSQQPDAAQVVAATGQKYLLAQRSGDWPEMCQLLNSRSQQALASNKKNNKLSGAAGCRAALEGADQKTQQALIASTAGVKIIRSAVNGQRGEILAKTKTGQKVIVLVQENGSWKIDLLQ